MTTAIAIVGMACEFPGAHSPEELWQNILSGRRYFRKAPKERIPSEYFDPDPTAPGKSYCDQMAIIEGWKFDPIAFGIPPVVYEASDIVHWLALFTARAAIQNAHLNLQTIDRTRMGVVLGNTMTGEFSRSHNLRFRWPYVERAIRRAFQLTGVDNDHLDKVLVAIAESYESPLPAITEDSLAGNMSNTIAGRICGYFDLGAGGYTVDGACSSSLLSIAQACNALACGDMDFALAGGVDISLDPFELVGFAKAQALARDDIRPYDECAEGMLVGEGCGLFVLMRETDARAAGHRIHALIRGWGISSDGAGGITAPEIEGQLRALKQAYDRAGYCISTVALIEGHGTGTTVGDKVEISAILRLLDSASGDGVCRIGSIKAQIGHCKAAAGAAGLIKAVMALKQKVVPPTFNCRTPNPVFGKPPTRLRPSLRGQAWESAGWPRRASVSSMGFGGANAHIALEEANPNDTLALEDFALLGTSQRSELILLSAPTAGELRQSVEKLIPIVERICRAELTDLAAALAKSCRPEEFRLAIVAESPWQLATLFRLICKRLSEGADLAALDDAASGIVAGKPLAAPTFVALFPGQGSQHLNMGEHVLRRYPFLRKFYQEAGGKVTRFIFRDTLAGEETELKQYERDLRDTVIAQPSIVLSSLAMLRVLKFFGLKPTISIGHSLGEISALHCAGAFDAVTAVRLATARGDAISSLNLTDCGAMVAIAAAPEDVQPLIEPFGESFAISNYNSPKQTVVSGPSSTIARLREVCAAKNIGCQQISVSHAFHSDIVARAATAFYDALKPATFRPLTSRCISTSTGSEVAQDEDLRELLAQQIRRPVRFVEAVRNAAAQRPALWIEIGPGGVLTSFLNDILGADSVHCLSTDSAADEGFYLLNQVLARAFVLGLPVATDRLFAYRFHRSFDVDNYKPVFIVNPCERAVEPTTSVESLFTGLPTGIAPEDINQTDFADYLKRRGSFLPEQIGLDYRHHREVQPSRSSRENREASIPIKPIHHAVSHMSTKESAATDKDGLLSFAVDWIAKRTGFRQSSLRADQRLRDDLNLDSIKARELIGVMASKAGRSLNNDPTALANSTLTQIVDAILRENPLPRDVPTASRTRAPEFQPASSLSNWIRTFRMLSTPSPIESEATCPLPTRGTAVILDSETTPQTIAIADVLRQRGFSIVVSNAQTLIQNRDASRDLAVVVLILPSEHKDFLTCSPNEFDERVEGMAKQLFQIFRCALCARESDRLPLRALVLRPIMENGDASSDLAAGAGFLKSVALEHPNTVIKCVSLPAHWSPEKWAEVTIRELEHTGRIAVAYSADGERTADLAHPMNSSVPSTPGLLSLSAKDVVLVSGGGKGITFELASDLSHVTRCKLALLGSSPLPTNDTENQRELLSHLEQLKRAGIAHIYVQADVTDLDAVRHAITEVKRRLGPVTGILHGAGISQVSLLRDKPLEEFLRAIRVKTRGLYNLLAVIPPPRIKMLHVLSSVLGNTGMKGQVDYTFANAWLDEAVRRLKVMHPHIHCLSVGYSVWAEAGLANKGGVVESLRTLGVTPISVKEGVAAYRRLLDASQAGSKYIVTGRLTPNLEAKLYARTQPTRGRFLEKVLRWIPTTELIAEATISHETDLYLQEHVFQGTPMFPGVMAIEAMVQAAMMCAGRDELPVLRNIVFHHAIIVPYDATVVVRTLALAEPWDGEAGCVRVAMRSGGDGFQQNHFEAECWFGQDSPSPEQMSLATLPGLLPHNPETLSPVPLFQGKFFRRIVGIRKQAMEDESWTDIAVPDGEVYFCQELAQTSNMPSPCLRDAALQSGAIILPPGCLPVRLEELRLHASLTAREILHCHTVVKERTGDIYRVDIVTWNTKGELVETVRNLVLQRPKSTGKPSLAVLKAIEPLPLTRISAELAALPNRQPHAIAFVNHYELESEPPEISCADRERIVSETAEPRRLSALANLLAARRATIQFARVHWQMELSPLSIALTHRADGKPELRIELPAETTTVDELDITLADCGDTSLAVVGTSPLGVDLEAVAFRDCETWRRWLGLDGYALALRVTHETGESFDCAATRVWTLLEAGKKAGFLSPILPQFATSLGGLWLSFNAQESGNVIEFVSVLSKHAYQITAPMALGLTLGRQNNREVRKGHLKPRQNMRDTFSFDFDYSGPQEQIVFTQRFPLSFRACQTPSAKVQFTSYCAWMGEVREHALTSMSRQLNHSFGEAIRGMTTNYFTVKVLDEVEPDDIVEARLWQEKMYEVGTIGILKCDWRKLNSNGERTRVASSEMGYSWVQVLEHGVTKLAPMPQELRQFLGRLAPNTDVSPKPLEELPSRYKCPNLGDVRWPKESPANNEFPLFSHHVATTMADSNRVQNIYFASYAEWMGYVSDLYFHRLTSESFRGNSTDGEWVSLNCHIDYLTEALPYETIVVKMSVNTIYDCGLVLSYDYSLLEKNKITRKLAHGKQTMAWVGRDFHNEPVLLQLPKRIVAVLLNELHRKD